MINSLETYQQCGEKAGKAARQKDQGMVSFQTAWYQRALRMESPADRVSAQAAFTAAYKQSANHHIE